MRYESKVTNYGLGLVALLAIGYLLLVGVVTPIVAHAEEPASPVGTTQKPPFIQLRADCDPTLPPTKKGSCDLAAFVGWVQKIITYLFYISIPIATMFVIWGAFVIMTAGGSEERFGKGKKVITAAIVGIIIVFTSSLIVTSIKKALEAGAEFLK